MVRRTREEQAAANRRALLDAARIQFERHGFRGASLDVIAEEAGFSKGAVYSRFASKDELFLEVIDDHIERRAAATAEQLEQLDESTVELVDLARASIGASVASVAWQAALMEFRAHAFRTPEINARYRELHERTVQSVAGFIAEVFRRRDETPPLPPERIARVALANATGIVAEYMADPDVGVDELIDMSITGVGGRLDRSPSQGAPA